jgi:hypothetical protein
LRFTARWSGDPWRAQELRAWVRRPDRLRVETTEGRLVQIVRESRRKGEFVAADGTRHPSLQPWWTDPDVPGPQFRADGLVAARPDAFAVNVCYDAPMYRDYFWVAMLDPVELADGRDPATGATVPGTVVDAVSEVEHAGRPAWEAIMRPTRGYAPRCTCCTLLRSREIDLAEAESGAGYDIVLDDYPDGYVVRLDTGTGVCVRTASIGGATPGSGHELHIEAVDDPIGDDLF